MRKHNNFIFTFMVYTLLITGLQACTDEISLVDMPSEKAQSLALFSLSPDQNSCKGIPGGIPWTYVDGSIPVRVACEDGTENSDSYERVKMYICEEGQVIEVGEFRGRLLQVAQCQRTQSKCGEYENGQARNLFDFQTALFPCPEDSNGAIELTYLVRTSELCQDGKWNSEGASGRTIYKVDDSSCQVRPPAGQACGLRQHNEVWSEPTDEKKIESCKADETGQIDYKKTTTQTYTCLNGTVSRTAYVVGDWDLVTNSCHKSCPQVGLTHGQSKSSTTKQTEVKQCDVNYTGQITRERMYTETLTCMEGVVNTQGNFGEWTVLQDTCKRNCDDGHKHGDKWRQVDTESKKENCASGFSGEVEYRKEKVTNLSCDNGSIVRLVDLGEWFEVGNTCKKMCEGGRIDGEKWSQVRSEQQTVNCNEGYRGQILQERQITTVFLCTVGAISSSEFIGNWVDKENSCVQLCPSGRSEGETWSEIKESTDNLTCPVNQIGEIVRKSKINQHYLCQKGQDKFVKSEIISSSEVKNCRPFNVSGRCAGDSLFATEVQGRRDWVRKCKDHPEIKFFFDMGGEKLYTHRNHYPSFGYIKNDKATKSWKAPVKSSFACDIPDGVKLLGLCTAGCFTENQNILFGGNKYQGIRSAMENSVKEVMVVHPESFLEDLRLVGEKINRFIVDLAPANQTILEFRTASGGRIQVTESHPMLTENGRLVDAQTLKVGKKLILYNGRPDVIVAIRKFEKFGKVYNLYPQSQELHKNLIVAQGFISGSAFYQSEGNEYMGRVILRHALVEDLFPRSAQSKAKK